MDSGESGRGDPRLPLQRSLFPLGESARPSGGMAERHALGRQERPYGIHQPEARGTFRAVRPGRRRLGRSDGQAGALSVRLPARRCALPHGRRRRAARPHRVLRLRLGHRPRKLGHLPQDLLRTAGRSADVGSARRTALNELQAEVRRRDSDTRRLHRLGRRHVHERGLPIYAHAGAAADLQHQGPRRHGWASCP